ncbi:MAG: class I SAM-dependent methyltransferase [Lachnospiraceae bacterium]|nr:class I SAM-dependent methyltransferase [Lachnospiraceae bacterium]
MHKETDLKLERIDGRLSLVKQDTVFYGDFTKLKKRLTHANLTHEMPVKACRIKNKQMPVSVLDATAGMGEDALLLAAFGFNVTLYERDETIYKLLSDTIERAKEDADLLKAVSRMTLFYEDSIKAMRELKEKPDVVYLDPMFPLRTKSGLVKKKFQLIHELEKPCEDENELLEAALSAALVRVVIKRPLKGEYLAGVKPDYSIEGSTIRYDCINR